MRSGANSSRKNRGRTNQRLFNLVFPNPFPTISATVWKVMNPPPRPPSPLRLMSSPRHRMAVETNSLPSSFAVIATVDVPKIPDLIGDIAGYHEARDLPHFKFLTLQHGATREEALNPAPTGPAISAAPPVTVPPEPIEMPQAGRKWVQALYTISPPPLAGPSIPGLQLK